MSFTGPVPKPTFLKLLEGNPGKRPLNENEAKPRTEIPRPPPFLMKRAKKIWKKNCKLLFECGLLTSLDGQILATQCNAEIIMKDAIEIYEKVGGPLAKSPKTGVPYLGPWMSAISSATQQIFKAAEKLGMSPSDRTRIEVDPKFKSKSEMEGMIE